MPNDKLFRSAIGGYNKDDVIKYIEDLNIRSTQTKEELEGEIRTLKAQLSELEELREIKTKYEELVVVHQQLLSEKDSLEQNVESLNDKLCLSKAELDKARDDGVREAEAFRTLAAERQEQLNKLEAQLKIEHEALESARQNCSELEEKSTELSKENAALTAKTTELTEQMSLQLQNFSEEPEIDEEAVSAQVQEVLEKSRNEAKELIDRAKVMADRIISEAREKASVDCEKVKAESQELVSNNLKKVKYLYKRKDELADIFREHKSKVDSFFASLSDSFKGDNK